jgi:hypothetical protein
VSDRLVFEFGSDIDLDRLLRGVTVGRDLPMGSSTVRVNFTISATIVDG